MKLHSRIGIGGSLLAACGLALLTPATLIAREATPAARISLPGERVIPESITSTSDGRIYIGSLGARTIFRAKATDKKAQPWVQPEMEAAQGIYGVFADERSNTLYACVSGFGPAGSSAAAELLALDLNTGKLQGRYTFPTEGGLCNDIATGPDGAAYVTDSRNMEILRLAPGGRALERWKGEGAFGPKGGVLDGIAVLGKRVFVNTLTTNKLFSIPIVSGGRAGDATEVLLDRPIAAPDGMRSWGDSALLLVESGDVGRVSRVDVSDNKGKVTTLLEGFSGGPVSATIVGTDIFVVEAQFGALRNNSPFKPFEALGFPLPKR
jgi:sugar lactone lactonase YvrE